MYNWYYAFVFLTFKLHISVLENKLSKYRCGEYFTIKLLISLLICDLTICGTRIAIKTTPNFKIPTDLITFSLSVYDQVLLLHHTVNSSSFVWTLYGFRSYKWMDRGTRFKKCKYFSWLYNPHIKGFFEHVFFSGKLTKLYMNQMQSLNRYWYMCTALLSNWYGYL